MIVMSVAVEQELDVFDGEAQVGDALLDDGRGFGQAAIKKNRAVRSLNEERRHIGGADVIDIADDAEWLDRLVPGGALVRTALRKESERRQEWRRGTQECVRHGHCRRFTAS